MNGSQSPGAGLAPFRQRQALSRSIYLHIRLTRVIYHEFCDIRRTHTVLLNILLVGGGSLISICASELLQVEDSFLKRFVLEAFIVSCLIPIILSLTFCITTEYTVSNTKGWWDLCIVANHKTRYWNKRKAIIFDSTTAKKPVPILYEADVGGKRIYRSASVTLHIDWMQDIRKDYRPSLQDCRPLPDDLRHDRTCK